MKIYSWMEAKVKSLPVAKKKPLDLLLLTRQAKKVLKSDLKEKYCAREPTMEFKGMYTYSIIPKLWNAEEGKKRKLRE